MILGGGPDCEAAKQYPDAANIWVKRLSPVSEADTHALFNQIPGDRITPIAISFSQEILSFNKMKRMQLDGF